VPLKQIKLSKSSIVFFLLAFAPAALILDFMDVNHILLFVVAAVALVPLAKLIGDSTEHLSFHYGPTAGSLLNVTFGNATEIIIAILAINSGLFGLVKASIIGSVLGNILLIFGLSIVVGGARFKEQSFSKENVGFQSSMLFLAIIGLAVPTILASVLNSSEGAAKIQLVSDALAFILLGVYILGIVFTFVTHKHLFVHVAEDKQGGSEGPKDVPWSKKRSILLLLASMAGVVAVSEVLVGSVEETGRELGFGQLFVGAIVVGIVGNAAEHSSAIMLARKGKIDLSIGIAAGSGTQVALFVVPILVIAGILLGQHFTLEFTLFELVTLFLAAIILNLIVHDGRSNWFEGAMLVAVYMIIAIGFFFL
jgi:Ca2+:H+ antiporter